MGMSAEQVARLGPAARRQIELMKLEEARLELAQSAVRMQAPAPAKKSKYGNVPVTIRGHRLDSQAEGRRFMELSAMEERGEIFGLIVHPVYRLEIGGALVCRYEADFQHQDAAGVVTVEDVKGVETPIFRLKKKLMKILLGIDVKVLKA